MGPLLCPHALHPPDNPLIDIAHYNAAVGVSTTDDAIRTTAMSLAALDGRKLTLRCRNGFFPELRGAMWCRLVCHDVIDAGTQGHLARMEVSWKQILTTVLHKPPGTAAAAAAAAVAAPAACHGMTPAQFGAAGPSAQYDSALLSAAGRAAAGRVLAAAKQLLAVDWCPALVDFVPLLLAHLPESAAYGVVEELWARRPLHFPVTRLEGKAWALAFGSIVQIFFPKLHAAMAACGALARRELEVIFHRLFLPLLRVEHAVQVWDAWLREGSKVLFRYGLALLSMFKRRIKALKLERGQGAQLWAHVARWAREAPDFNFNALRARAFGVRTRRLRRPLTWGLLEASTEAMRDHPYLLQLSDHEPALDATSTSTSDAEAAAALTAVRAPGTDAAAHSGDGGAAAAAAAAGGGAAYWPPLQFVSGSAPWLLQDDAHRAALAAWVPETLRHRRLRVAFSTEGHGYNLAHLYKLCRGAAPTLLVLEVAATRALIGAFCTEPWHVSTSMYGSGQCFLFTLTPEARRYAWTHSAGAAAAAQHGAAGTPPAPSVAQPSRHWWGGLLAAADAHEAPPRRGSKGGGDAHAAEAANGGPGHSNAPLPPGAAHASPSPSAASDPSLAHGSGVAAAASAAAVAAAAASAAAEGAGGAAGGVVLLRRPSLAEMSHHHHLALHSHHDRHLHHEACGSHEPPHCAAEHCHDGGAGLRRLGAAVLASGVSLHRLTEISAHGLQRLGELAAPPPPLSSRHRAAAAAAQRAAALAAGETSFQFGTPHFLGLGASATSAACGLKLHEGLTRASSGPCATFGNPCLIAGGGGGGGDDDCGGGGGGGGAHRKAEFDVSCVEVYAFT